jgi:hypothetical protein
LKLSGFWVSDILLDVMQFTFVQENFGWGVFGAPVAGHYSLIDMVDRLSVPNPTFTWSVGKLNVLIVGIMY